MTRGRQLDPAGRYRGGRIFAFRDISSEPAFDSESDFVSSVLAQLGTAAPFDLRLRRDAPAARTSFRHQERKNLRRLLASGIISDSPRSSRTAHVARLDTGDLRS